MKDNKRQKIIFVNDTNISSKNEEQKLSQISSSHPNVVFFTHRKYKSNETDLINDITTHTDHNIYLGGKSFIPVRGVSDSKSSVIINDGLISLNLDTDTGLLNFGYESAISKIELEGIYYTFDNNISDNYIKLHTYPNNITDLNNYHNGDYAYTRTNDLIPDLGVTTYTYINDIGDTLCFMMKITANEKAVNPVIQGPELIFYKTENDINKTYTTYFEEYNYPSIDSSIEPNNIHRKAACTTIENNKHVSYIPYIYKITDFVRVGTTDPIDLKCALKNDIYKSCVIKPSCINVSPVINKFELVEVPTNDDDNNYNNYSKAKYISALSFDTNGNTQVNTQIPVEDLTYKLIPDRTIYKNYNDLMRSFKYWWNFDNDKTITIGFYDISNSGNPIEYKMGNGHSELTYNNNDNTITFNKDNISSEKRTLPLKNYRVKCTIDANCQQRYSGINNIEVIFKNIKIDDFAINKTHDTFIISLYAQTTNGNRITGFIENLQDINGDQYLSINNFNSSNRTYQFPANSLTYSSYAFIIDKELDNDDYLPVLMDPGYDGTGVPTTIVDDIYDPESYEVGGRQYNVYRFSLNNNVTEDEHFYEKVWSFKYMKIEN